MYFKALNVGWDPNFTHTTTGVCLLTEIFTFQRDKKAPSFFRGCLKNLSEGSKKFHQRLTDRASFWNYTSQRKGTDSEEKFNPPLWLKLDFQGWKRAARINTPPAYLGVTSSSFPALKKFIGKVFGRAELSHRLSLPYTVILWTFNTPTPLMCAFKTSSFNLFTRRATKTWNTPDDVMTHTQAVTPTPTSYIRYVTGWTHYRLGCCAAY